MKISPAAVMVLAAQVGGVQAFAGIRQPRLFRVAGYGLSQRATARFATEPEQGIIEKTEAAVESDSVNTPIKKEDFENDGLFGWMQPFLKQFGIEEGKSLNYGLISKGVDPSKRVSGEEAAKRRQAAQQQMVNIGPEERSRRDKAGNYVLLASAIYAAFACLTDNGGLEGHFARFLTVIPFWLGYSFKLSAKEGL
jgi:hypothetical protein